MIGHKVAVSRESLALLIVDVEAVAYREHRLIVGAPKSGKSRRVDLPEALVVRLRARQSVSEAEAAVAGREPSPWCSLLQATIPSR